jgi:hypothetical protein
MNDKGLAETMSLINDSGSFNQMLIIRIVLLVVFVEIQLSWTFGLRPYLRAYQSKYAADINARVIC